MITDDENDPDNYYEDDERPSKRGRPPLSATLAKRHAAEAKSRLVAAVRENLEDAFRSMKFGHIEWLNELRAVAQAAAAEGKYEIALEAYDKLGRAMGIQNLHGPATTHNHVHLGGGQGESQVPVAELDSAELEERIALLENQTNAKIVEAEVVESQLEEI